VDEIGAALSAPGFLVEGTASGSTPNELARDVSTSDVLRECSRNLNDLRPKAKKPLRDVVAFSPSIGFYRPNGCTVACILLLCSWFSASYWHMAPREVRAKSRRHGTTSPTEILQPMEIVEACVTQ